MKLITRDTDYAIRALCFIAKNEGRIVSVSGLVKAVGVPRPFIRKILQILNKKGLLISYKGKGGGFRLNRVPVDMNVLELIEAFQGPFELSEHKFKGRACLYIKKCRLREKICKIEKQLAIKLRNITIASLIK